MPFVAPLLFGSSEGGYTAILEFGGQSDPGGGAISEQYDPDTITVVSDPTGIFGSVQSTTNYRYIEWATFGTYEFTILQNYSSSNIDSELVESYISGGSIQRGQTIVTLTSGTTILNPSPVEKTIVDNSLDDGLTVRIAASSAQREVVGTLRVGIKAV